MFEQLWVKLTNRCWPEAPPKLPS